MHRRLHLCALAGLAGFTATLAGGCIAFNRPAETEGLVGGGGTAYVDLGPPAADHFEIVSGDNQSKQIGLWLDSPLVVRVVDQYGDPVAGHSVLFSVAAGDATIRASESIDVTDASGLASVNVRGGISAPRSRVVVRSLTEGELPDLAATGDEVARLRVNSVVNPAATGTFSGHAAIMELPDSHSYETLFVADFNKDTFPDYVFSGPNYQDLWLRLSTGAATFAPDQYYDNADGIEYLADEHGNGVVADVDGDTYLDLVLGFRYPHQVAILHYNSATDVFDPPVTYDAYPLDSDINIRAIGAGDLDGDTYPEVIVAYGRLAGATNVSIGVLYNNFGATPGAFGNLTTVAGSPVFDLIRVGEFDNANGVDVAAVNTDGTATDFSIFWNTGAGALGAPQSVALPSAPYGLAAGDLDEDNLTDFAVAFYDANNLRVYLQNGGLHVFAEAGGSPYSCWMCQGVEIAQFRFDAPVHLDVLGYREGGAGMVVLEGDGSGVLVDNALGKHFPEYWSQGSRRRIYDRNGDGLMDIALLGPGGLNWFMDVTGAADFESDGISSSFMFTVGVNPYRALAADFDGDDHVDVAVVDQANGDVEVYPGNGAGAFGAAVVSALADLDLDDVAVFDFDGDDDLDLAMASSSANAIRLLENNGSGSFSLHSTIALSAPETISAADMDGDGDVDLLRPGQNSVAPALLLNDGAGGFSEAVGVLPGGMLVTSDNGYAALCDLTGNGLPDIALIHDLWATPNLEVFPNQGGLAFGAALAGAGGRAGLHRMPVCADFDNDGDFDIGSVDPYAGNGFLVYLNDGTGVLDDGSNFLLTQPLRGTDHPALGDFNGDGLVDLGLWSQETELVIHPNGGAGFLGFGDTVTYPLPLQWGGQPLKDATTTPTADVNEDGRVDIILLDAYNGNISILTGN
ncbi:MAG: VCBS repeat-containing protein [Bdellovibrionales bacterium]|nr:VCBS repeat-containing protein [Bdellovibrionales bacterium]